MVWQGGVIVCPLPAPPIGGHFDHSVIRSGSSWESHFTAVVWNTVRFQINPAAHQMLVCKDQMLTTCKCLASSLPCTEMCESGTNRDQCDMSSSAVLDWDNTDGDWSLVILRNLALTLITENIYSSISLLKQCIPLLKHNLKNIDFFKNIFSTVYLHNCSRFVMLIPLC